jgi:phosphate transport system permease protein
MHKRDRFESATKYSSIFLLVILISLVLSLVIQSWPSIKTFGIHFIYSLHWDPVNEQFGAITAIIGTLLTSVIAIMIALPLSIGIALLISQILPAAIATPLARTIELMAGIPSIIYGMWGLFVLAPFLASHVQPGLINFFQNLTIFGKHIPLLEFIFGGLPIGISLFAAGVILAIMILPLMASTMRDVLNTVPTLMTEAAYGVGATRWEVCHQILIRYARAGLFGATILGLGRALGETMAVTFVVGNSHDMPSGLFMPGTTISAAIANEFTEATGKLYQSSLIELGLILLFISFISLVISRKILHRSQTRGGAQ